MIRNKLEQSWSVLQHKAFEVVNRARDRHIRLAVTGLSRSGKTAFITARPSGPWPGAGLTRRLAERTWVNMRGVGALQRDYEACGGWCDPPG